MRTAIEFAKCSQILDSLCRKETFIRVCIDLDIMSVKTKKITERRRAESQGEYKPRGGSAEKSANARVSAY